MVFCYYDTQHSVILHNDTQHNDILHYDAQHDDTRQSNKNSRLSILTLSMTTFYITVLSINTLIGAIKNVTLSMTTFYITMLRISETHHNNKKCHSQHRIMESVTHTECNFIECRYPRCLLAKYLSANFFI